MNVLREQARRGPQDHLAGRPRSAAQHLRCEEYATVRESPQNGGGALTRRIHALLLAGCAVIAILQLPAATRSLGESWNGPYSPSVAYDGGHQAPAAGDRVAAGSLLSADASAKRVTSIDPAAAPGAGM